MAAGGETVIELSCRRDTDRKQEEANHLAKDIEHTGSAVPSSQPYVVDWEGEDDPRNPRNWKTLEKTFNTSLIIVLVFLTPLASSMFTPAIPQVLQTFNTQSATIAEFVVSIYILGFAVGPLIISPLSEVYGRYPVYVVCNIIFVIFTVACALAHSMTQLILFRFFAGCFGVCPVALGGASISDLIPQERRGAALSMFGMGPLLGPVIGPICGSYISADIGWRWTFWIVAIAYGIFTILHALFCHETYAPVLLARITTELQISSGDGSLRSSLDDGLSKEDRLKRGIIRPLKLLLFSQIAQSMALYCAVVYGIQYLLYTTYTFVFQDFYGFSDSDVGLVYIGSGIGMMLGLALIGITSDRFLKTLAKKHDGELKPEYRLVPVMCMAWLCPVGLFIYGWTAQNRIQWAVPLFGTALFGFGVISALICIQQYVIDAFTVYAASATAANTVLRSILGGILPLAGLSIYNKLGFAWGNSLIAFISLVIAPVPFIFFIYGERIRKASKVKL